MTTPHERAIEAMALALCKWDDVDPDKICYGMGVHVPKGESCTALELRKMTVRAILPESGLLDLIEAQQQEIAELRGQLAIANSSFV